jgi:diaminohydroxyphosphoribosylaminopyrimidine deaminase/5-amino-6-(5-phosphoribosylamino)uracil reductase
MPADTPSPRDKRLQARDADGAKAHARAIPGIAPRGIVLVEALVSLALLAIGMASLLALQFHMRLAADDARQQDAALRLVRNELEHWRVDARRPDPALIWEGPSATYQLAGRSAAAETLPDLSAIPAATPDLDEDPLPARSVHLRVTWTDRAGRARALTLDSLVSALDPALSGLLLLAPDRTARLRPMQVPGTGQTPISPSDGDTLRATPHMAVAPPDADAAAPSPADEAWMARALALAEQAVGLTDPNPRVGCVIVDRDGRVLGQGHTQAAGQAHAEVMALRDAQTHGHDVRGATVYVTLEPCAHHGRTPPCCDALAAAGVGRVVIALGDPNPLVGGQGTARLRAAGIVAEVIPPSHPLAVGAAELNIGFLSRMRTGRPFLRLKVASSLDGRTALANGVSQWITGPEARRDGHAWRRRAGAVLTGIGTAREDNPRLDVRDVETARQPRRVLIDSRLELATDARLLAPPGELLIYHALPDPGDRGRALQDCGAELVSLTDPRGKVDLAAAVRDLGARGVNELHIEAGYKLNGSLLRTGLVDELLVYLAPMLMGDGRGMADLGALTALDQAPRYRIVDSALLGGDLRLRLRPGAV